MDAAQIAAMIADREAGTPGPWKVDGPVWNQIVWTDNENRLCFMAHSNGLNDGRDEANARRIARVPDMEATIIAQSAELEQLRNVLAAGRRAIGDHFAPHDCYATGPMTGDIISDFVQCPACTFIAMHDAAPKGGTQ